MKCLHPGLEIMKMRKISVSYQTNKIFAGFSLENTRMALDENEKELYQKEERMREILMQYSSLVFKRR